MPQELETAIEDNAKGPAKATGDSGSIEQHKLSEQIAADRYLCSKKAVANKGLGIRMKRVVPPGAS